VSINRRTTLVVRSVGVASAAAALALGVAGNAFACTIGEFTPTAECDNGQASIKVVDKDYSSTPVTITVTQGATKVGEQSGVRGSREGTTVTFAYDWKPSTTYSVTVVREDTHQQVGTTPVTTPAEACTTPAGPAPVKTTPAGPAPSGPAPAKPAPGKPAPVATTSAPTVAPSSAAAVADTNAPSPAAGSANLAETGGGSNTGMIAGIAGALVAVGGGTVFMMRRRKPAARH
jgi:LPXTG-motif cell wall-anchored protein